MCRRPMLTIPHALIGFWADHRASACMGAFQADRYIQVGPRTRGMNRVGATAALRRLQARPLPFRRILSPGCRGPAVLQGPHHNAPHHVAEALVEGGSDIFE